MREINEGAKVNANSFFVNCEDINSPSAPLIKKAEGEAVTEIRKEPSRMRKPEELGTKKANILLSIEEYGRFQGIH